MNTGRMVDFTKMRLGSRPTGYGKITICWKCGRRGEELVQPPEHGRVEVHQWYHTAEVYTIPPAWGQA